MPDQTARDAVAGSIFNATFTAEWDDCPDGYQETRAMILRDADAILAALGIPPDTTTSEISAGLAALRMAPRGIDLGVVLRTRTRPISKAAALLAYYGVTQRSVGIKMDRTVAVVSRQLAGLQPVTDPLRDALVRMIGPDAAAEVLAAVPNRETVAA